MVDQFWEDFYILNKSHPWSLLRSGKEIVVLQSLSTYGDTINICVLEFKQYEYSRSVQKQALQINSADQLISSQGW